MHIITLNLLNVNTFLLKKLFVRRHKKGVLNLLNFYDKYINLCASQNKSPSKVAEEIGLSRPAVSSWKTGKAKPSDVTMLKIAAYFTVKFNHKFTFLKYSLNKTIKRFEV